MHLIPSVSTPGLHAAKSASVDGNAGLHCSDMIAARLCAMCERI